MRTSTENQAIDKLARAILRKRGVTEPTFAAYADAAEIAASAVAQKGTGVTLAETLAVAAAKDVVVTADDQAMIEVLGRFASDGRFICDLSLDEESLLREVVQAEQAADVQIAADAGGRQVRRSRVLRPL